MSETLPLDYSESLAKSDGMLGVMVAAFAVRALVVALGFISVATANGRIQLVNASGHPWVAWDGDHYLDIAQRGYPPTSDSGYFYDIAYFPLYPLAVRGLTAISALDAASAMVLIANTCSLIGMVFLYAWAKKLAGPRVAAIASFICACYPGAVFFSGGLTEGPFFMMVAIALWLLQQDKFWFAAVVAAIATATRPTGIALAAIVPLYAWTRLPHVPFAKRAMIMLALGVVSIMGGLIYEAFLWQRYGMWDAYMHAQASWELQDQARLQQSSDVPRYSLQFFLSRIHQPQAWNRIIAVGILAVTAIGMVVPMKMPRVLLLMPLIIFLMTYLPNNGLRASSIFRYEAPAVPLFVLAALWLAHQRWRYVLLVTLGVQLILQCYYAIMFSRGAWVG